MAKFFGRYSESELRTAMSRALDEAADLERRGLRRKYGFGPAKKFVAVAAGHHFDSKALVAAAAAHLRPPLALTPDEFSGGSATTRILDACGVPWIDTDHLTSVPELPILVDPDMSDGAHPKYWWVTQNNNYATVIEQGSLWAPDLRADGHAGHQDWQALHLMRPGDVVFHYASQQLRAISVIVSAGVKADRPPGYLPEGGYPHGTLVLLEPCITDMEVGMDVLIPVFSPGVGPMNSTGTPGPAYTAPVPRTIGGPLAKYLSGGSLAMHSFGKTSAPNGVADARSGRDFESTDIAGTTLRRAEQRYLRQSPLARYGNQCAICGRVLPKSLLVAAHIRLRSQSSEADRLNFDAAAMLACALGCDALFELGYVTVDAAGDVRTMSMPDPALWPVLKTLEGSRCLAFSEATEKNFEVHRQRHVNQS